MKLSLKFLVLSLTDFEREGGREGKGGGERKREGGKGERGGGRENNTCLSLNFCKKYL